MQQESSEIKHFTSTEELPPNSPTNKKYVKITDQVKNSFLKFIIEQNMSIKKASQALRINYSSAKAILSSHKKIVRKNRINLNENLENTNRSSYKLIGNPNPATNSKFSINCSVGGRSNDQHQIAKRKTIFKPSILVPVPAWANHPTRQSFTSC